MYGGTKLKMTVDNEIIYLNIEGGRIVNLKFYVQWNVFQKLSEDFPGSPVVRNPPASSQGTRVQSPVQEDSTCHGATKSRFHNCWSQRAPEPVLTSERRGLNGKTTDCN